MLWVNLNNLEFMSECGKHPFSLVGKGERMMVQLKHLVAVLPLGFYRSLDK